MAEPLTLAEAKAQCRVLDDSEDAYIESLIAPARVFVENLSGVTIVQRDFTESHLPCRGVISLLRRPVFSINEIAYTDSNEQPATYAGARTLTGSSMIFPALGGSWPSPYAGEQLSVTYTAGLSEGELATDDWSPLLHAMKLLIGHWFANRETVNIGNITSELPFTVQSLCDQYRAPGV